MFTSGSSPLELGPTGQVFDALVCPGAYTGVESFAQYKVLLTPFGARHFVYGKTPASALERRSRAFIWYNFYEMAFRGRCPSVESFSAGDLLVQLVIGARDE